MIVCRPRHFQITLECLCFRMGKICLGIDMQPFCTTMICSYKRPRLLLNAIQSIRDTSSNPKEHEVLVRLSDADPESQIQKRTLMCVFKNIRVFIGPHMEGYTSLGDYFTEMAKYATGKWLHIFDDDMTLEGNDWDGKLRGAPDRCLALCQIYRLGGTQYGPGSCDGPGIAWWVQRSLLNEVGGGQIGNPPDTWVRDLLVNRNGWPIHHLQDIILNHAWQRPTDGDR